MLTSLPLTGFQKRMVSSSPADDFVIGDLRDPLVCKQVVKGINEIYQLAADMGGAGFVFTGDNDADIMHNSALINLNMVERAKQVGTLVGDRAKAAGVERVVFDRAGFKYHGRIRALAEGARDSGLEF